MLGVFLWVVGVDTDVVEVHNNIDVEHISEDVIHEALEGSWSISESKRHD